MATHPPQGRVALRLVGVARWRVVRISLAGAALLVLCSAAAADGRAGLGDGVGSTLGPAERVGLDRRAEAITVRVVGASCRGTIQGSGFVVDGWLYTNRHLVEAVSTIAVSSDAGSAGVLAAVEARAAELDLATAPVVPGPGLGFEPARLAATDAEVGDEVVLAGWVSGSLALRTARVHLYAAGAAYGTGRTVMLLEPATTYGFSGGPVLNAAGEVVGILSAVDLTTGLTVAVPVSELHEWRQNGKRRTAPTSC